MDENTATTVDEFITWLIRFWTGFLLASVAHRIDKYRSGGKEG